MKRKSIGLMFILSVFMMVCFSLPAFGDVGNFNDYSGGGGGYSGGSDWGGSYDYGSGSDWDNNDTYVFGGSTSGGSGNGGSGDFGFSGMIMTVIIIAFLVVFSMIRQKRRRKGGVAPSVNNSIPVAVKNNTAVILPAIHEVDPDFNEEKFIAWTKEVFITMQQAWMERDWSKIRPFEKEELYRQHEMQLKEYINLGRINVIERININQAYLQRYERREDYETLDVFMQVRMVDYIKDEKTDAVLKGNPNQDCHLRYLLTFMRKTGVLTDGAKSGQSTVSCPHCGAPTQITSAGQCEYCGFIVTTGEYDWVLSNIDGVKPQTVIDNRGVIINDAVKTEAYKDTQE